MTPTPRSPKSYNKTLELSPEARAKLAQALPLEVEGDQVFIWRKTPMPSYAARCEIVNFIAALVNEALTPAAPAVTVIPESNLELGQLITTELETEQRWTAEDILRRKG